MRSLSESLSYRDQSDGHSDHCLNNEIIVDGQTHINIMFKYQGSTSKPMHINKGQIRRDRMEHIQRKS